MSWRDMTPDARRRQVEFEANIATLRRALSQPPDTARDDERIESLVLKIANNSRMAREIEQAKYAVSYLRDDVCEGANKTAEAFNRLTAELRRFRETLPDELLERMTAPEGK